MDTDRKADAPETLPPPAKKKRSPRMPSDPGLRALVAFTRALEQESPASQRAAIRWLAEAFNVTL